MNRFCLEKYSRSRRFTCPQCGKPRCFARYIDLAGIITFPDNVGRCDHLNHCGYHYTPRQYFRDHPDPARDRLPRPQLPPPPPPREPSYMTWQDVRKSFVWRDNALLVWMAAKLGTPTVLDLLTSYNVGSVDLWGGATVFWQVDCHGRVRGGKIMQYDRSTGHRVKQPFARVSWMHSYLHLPDYNLVQCYFGENLLRHDPGKAVVIVESEKTAMLCAARYPQMVWIATGGLSNLRPSECLRGRNVILMPDLGGEQLWEFKARALSAICRSVTVSRALSDATAQERQAGLDIGDFL